MRWMAIGVVAFGGLLADARADPPPPKPAPPPSRVPTSPPMPGPSAPPAPTKKPKGAPPPAKDTVPARAGYLVGRKHDLALEIKAPQHVRVNAPFTIEVRCHNVGHITLDGVRGGFRPSGTTKTASGLTKKRTQPRIRPGTHWKIAETFIAQAPGLTRVTVSFRDAKGWAATGALVSIQVRPAAVKPGKAKDVKVAPLDLSVDAHDVKHPKPGKPFPVTVWVENRGALELADVLLAVKAEGGLALTPASLARVDIKSLKVGRKKALTVECVLARKADPKQTFLTVSAREQRGWSAAGLKLPIHEKP